MYYILGKSAQATLGSYLRIATVSIIGTVIAAIKAPHWLPITGFCLFCALCLLVMFFTDKFKVRKIPYGVIQPNPFGYTPLTAANVLRSVFSSPFLS
jgi:hypothetical protein